MTDPVLRRISEGLCLLGVGIAGYLTYVHYAGLQPICEIGHGCETVQTSRYVAFGFSLYLTYRELFTIHAICTWCVSSAIVFTLLAIVSSRRVLQADSARASALAPA
jgi:hypothetical protein